tara:strand:- start:484 stop:1107 length:624 start_codon:yes stop_codon:yes gene_type:complete
MLNRSVPAVNGVSPGQAQSVVVCTVRNWNGAQTGPLSAAQLLDPAAVLLDATNWKCVELKDVLPFGASASPTAAPTTAPTPVDLPPIAHAWDFRNWTSSINVLSDTVAGASAIFSKCALGLPGGTVQSCAKLHNLYISGAFTIEFWARRGSTGSFSMNFATYSPQGTLFDNCILIYAGFPAANTERKLFSSREVVTSLTYFCSFIII